MHKSCQLIGWPVQSGAAQPGCLMGPAALRTAGLPEALKELGWSVRDQGDLLLADQAVLDHANPALKNFADLVGWTKLIHQQAFEAAATGAMPIFLGGDHSLAAGSVSAMARYAQDQNRPAFVLWLDAHPDLHDLHSTTSGNLHGTPMAYVTGQAGFEGLPPLTATVPPENVCMMGIRSVDPAEAARIRDTGITIHDMRSIDEQGVVAPLRDFLNKVAAANGMLHVSLDVDFLDPSVAPAVGTTVPGGATFREAHLIMEMLHDSGLVTSLDVVELNPFLDERGRTAILMADLVASLCGRRVLDRMTGSF